MTNEVLFSKIDELMNELKIPGVAIGVTLGDKSITKGFGVTNINNPLQVDEDTLFQIGSITKTFLGTMTMMLVEKNEIDLDSPVQKYLPEFEVMDVTATKNVTVRHLLTHTAGWIGDWFPSGLDQGSESVKEYVDTMKDDPQLTLVGKLISYNNAGFNLLGRILEVVTGTVFSDLIKEMIFEPLEMSHTYILPWELMTYRFASGHNITEDEIEVATPWFIGRSSGPAGGIISCVNDMLNYIRFQLGDGTYNGKRLITKESLEKLHSPLVQFTPYNSIGLTFWIDDSRNVRTLGHGGGTVGQISLLTIVPERNFGVITVTNCAKGGIFNSIITNLALKLYLDVDTPDLQLLDLPNEKLQEYVGEYEAKLTALKIQTNDGGLVISQKRIGGFPTEDEKPEKSEYGDPMNFRFYEQDHLTGVDDNNKATRAQFIRDETGKIVWFRFGSRLHKPL